MKKHIYLFFLSILFLFNSCSDLKVTADYDKNADFSSFKTFNIKTYQSGEMESTPLKMMTVSFIEEAIIDELMDRGYTLSDNPDIEVYYYVKLNDETKVSTTGVSGGMYGGSPYYYGYYGGYSYYENYQVVDYTEGSLIIELVDNNKDRAIWQGIGTQSVTQETASQKSIQQIVYSIFSSYKWKVETSPINTMPKPKTIKANQ